MILGPTYRGPSILSKVLWTLSCSPWVLWALEMEQSVRTPLWEAKVVSCADAGERINKSMRRKSICREGLSEQLRTRQGLAQEHSTADQSLGQM